MKKVIVTTTINPPTEAIERFDARSDWTIVVIGDLKTPKDYKLKNGLYISPAEQEKYDQKLSDAIGWKCIQRRSFGLLWAHDMKADVVAVIDDDNIPYEGWGEDLLLGKEVEVNYYDTDLPAFDPVGATNEKHLWHRGYPLQLVPKRDYSRIKKQKIICDVQADFWNGDPDIDAVCRMIYAPECNFEPGFFPLAANKPAPFNSQNTFLKGSLLKDYFLFPHVGRMDDIWAAYYVQARGAKVVFNKASVYQQRNIHDLVVDMKKEYIGYENNFELLKAISHDPETLLAYLPERSKQAFALYRRHFNA
ncbi:hypothetical protein A2291_02145 [candidate division WOR-1 bacterium RIFOXYB2_FULL_42_35]|uniref:Uncharacterized protein n=1 Tax=candidate division WOR-1 bacterium RIFOXYC2_FULL_41_25 TaxID=1802586 RepID=A0A1F4TQ12_UNCSA|nr:MAG: hypothetical protein A2247_03945 [candidate division WOR-1 bacterium RIFOXYA2_FULL_41_14]OGC25200.1 MAG: hypothetical protein A2291_02145 [candidate division WOR-1 bacterium RIFOXYB2_FULL_42_35]OGC34756.1 MAG: hypothetical protein A2462_03460 [candidate division WOR-1 bacterium RIFOXYC2_FULL_41_25]OGC44135.1 MAG: hypothetical protein A2548_03840 [candidate division WOR-1 bacterium RIFOXYD2_FULL_41_8]